MPSPEESWLSLTKGTNRVPVEQVASIFSALKPTTADFLTRNSGEWQGGDINTGHIASQQLIDMKWAGKTFHSAEHVEPVMVYGDDGKRQWNSDWGYARLRDVRFGNENTIAMIYDNFPIIDYFRYVSEDMVAGVMDSKLHNEEHGAYYFYLTRMKHKPSSLL